MGGHTERVQLRPHCSSCWFLVSKCVLTVKYRRGGGGMGSCSVPIRRMQQPGAGDGHPWYLCKLLSAVGLGISAGSRLVSAL